MEFRLLGSVEVVAGEPVAIPRKRERLIDLLWDGEPPPQALGALRSHVSRLRVLLPGELVSITKQDGGYLRGAQEHREATSALYAVMGLPDPGRHKDALART